MHREEAKWLGEKLSAISIEDLDPLLDIGGSTREFRTKVQPWIHELVFAPLQERGVRVLHQDVREGDGVDLKGDLLDRDFSSRLQGMGFRAVICANLLEHLERPAEILSLLKRLVPPGGFIFVTVPHRYPWHADPVDTRYRPSPADLARQLEGVEEVLGQEIPVGRVLDELKGDPKAAVRLAMRLAVPYPRPLGWYTAVNRVRWMLRERTISAIQCRRTAEVEADRRRLA